MRRRYFVAHECTQYLGPMGCTHSAPLVIHVTQNESQMAMYRCRRHKRRYKVLSRSSRSLFVPATS